MAQGIVICAIFILSLFFSSLFVSYFASGFTGDNSIEVIDIEKLINSDIGFNSKTDLTRTCNLSSYDLIGSWSCGATGLSLNGAGSLRVPFNDRNADGIYVNSYRIINPSGEYKIIITDTKYGDYIHLKVLSDGLVIPSTIAIPLIGHYETGIAWNVPISNALMSDVTIKTTYNINSNELTIVYNGESYIVPPMSIPPNYLAPSEVTNNQGVISDNSLTISSLSNSFTPVKTETSTALDGLAMTLNLAYSMSLLVTFRFPYHIIPVFYQVILILPQELMILVGAALFARQG
jgi:hypothetical protein